MRGTLLLLAASLACAARARAAAPACAYDGSFCVDLPSGLEAAPVTAFRKGTVTPLLLVSSGAAHVPVLILTVAPGRSAKAAAADELARLRARKDERFAPTDPSKVRVPHRWFRAWTYRNGCLDAARCEDWAFVYLDDGGRVVKAAFPAAERERALRILGSRKPQKNGSIL